MTETDPSRRSSFADPQSSAAWMVRHSGTAFLLAGLASIAFGLLALLAPSTAPFVLGAYFAAALGLEGAAAVASAAAHRTHDGAWAMAAIGALGLGVAAVALLAPPASVAVLAALAGFQAIALGLLTLALGHRVRRVADTEWVLYLIGAVSVGFGVAIVAGSGGSGAASLVPIGFWAIVTGVLRAVFGLSLQVQPPAWARDARRRTAG